MAPAAAKPPEVRYYTFYFRGAPDRIISTLYTDAGACRLARSLGAEAVVRVTKETIYEDRSAVSPGKLLVRAALVPV